jgi:hypothetical protein
MPERPKLSATRIKAMEDQQKALELRRMAKGYQEIADALSIGLATAHRYVKAAMADARAQITAQADELRAEELSRLDGMLAGLWPRARRGEAVAVDRVLKIGERRAKLLGLDAPTRTALQGGGEDAPPIVTEARVTIYMPDNGRG